MLFIRSPLRVNLNLPLFSPTVVGIIWIFMLNSILRLNAFAFTVKALILSTILAIIVLSPPFFMEPFAKNFVFLRKRIELFNRSRLIKDRFLRLISTDESTTYSILCVYPTGDTSLVFSGPYSELIIFIGGLYTAIPYFINFNQNGQTT